MPALWSPEDLAARFAPYIEELHDVFMMHGLHYGSPDDIRPLTERLQTSGSLHEELASLVRSMVLREGGSIPRTDLLEIVAIAIAGPRMDPAGEELQPSVRQLLTFLHSALRRPWNEPPGEERLHPAEEDPRSEAARELREAAAKIEAEVHGAAREPQGEIEAEVGSAAHAPRANVIPFGRARAVFSRLARTDADKPWSDEDDFEEREVSAPAASAAEVAGDQVSQAFTSQRGSDVVEEIPAASPIAGVETPAKDRMTMSRATERGTEAEMPLPLPETVGSMPIADGITAKAEPVLPEANGDVPAAPREAVILAVAESAQTPAVPLATPVPPAAPPSGVPAHRSAPRATAIPEFDEEPPLPPAFPHINRVAFAYGLAAAVFLTVGLGFALRTRTTTHPAAAASREALVDVPAPAQASATGAPSAAPATTSTAATAKPGPGVDLSSQAAHGSHFDDDYVAAPYSVQTQPPPAAAAGPTQQAVAPSPSPASNPQQPSAQQVSETRVEAFRPRDPDARLVGDAPLRATTVALAEPPQHPHISGGVMAQNLVSAPRPDYPVLAKLAHVDGPVVLHAEITRGGAVSDTQVISGHYLLRHAAEAAARHWRFRPYQVDGKPVSVSTTITVRFRH